MSLYEPEQKEALKAVSKIVQDEGGELVSRQAKAVLRYLVDQIESLRNELDDLRDEAGL